jgi:hypothetical protein
MLLQDIGDRGKQLCCMTEVRQHVGIFVDTLQSPRCRLGDALDINAMVAQLGGQTSILARSANG